MTNPINRRNIETNEPTPSGNKYGIVKKEYTPEMLFITTISGFKEEGNKISIFSIFRRNAGTGKESFCFHVEIAGERIVVFADKELTKTLTDGAKVERGILVLYTRKGKNEDVYTVMGKTNNNSDNKEIDWD